MFIFKKIMLFQKMKTIFLYIPLVVVGIVKLEIDTRNEIWKRPMCQMHTMVFRAVHHGVYRGARRELQTVVTSILTQIRKFLREEKMVSCRFLPS